MTLSPSQWHDRYCLQARWTQDLRRYIYAQTSLPAARSVLDVGCGTGALLSELASRSQAVVIGLDINVANINYAHSSSPEAHLALGDAHNIPFPASAFDITLCHYLLLWVCDPLRVLKEMARVTRPGGAVLALAEPDYGGRIDYPLELEIFNEWQQASLRRQGADPWMGRRLGSLFHQAGLASIETGVLGGQWKEPIFQADLESEWTMLQTDLEALFPPGKLAVIEKEFTRLRRLESDAVEQGERLLFLPTFYALGRVS